MSDVQTSTPEAIQRGTTANAADAPAHPAEIGHGNSVAAWTGCGIILLAFLVACLGLIWGQPIILIIGVIGCLAGVAAWIGLTKAGYGEGGSKSKARHH